LHGGADRPEWACGEWVGVARSHPFVLCPRGARNPGSPDTDPRYGWGSNAEVAKELRAALAALKHRFGNYVASGPVVMGAFSEGVAPAAQIVEQEPSFFSRVAFVGPTDGAWTAGFAGVFANRGGLRLLVVCTDAACKSAAQADLVFSRGAGTPTRLLEPGEFGRVLDGRVTDVLARELPWLVDGAPFWPSYASPSAPSASR
jgi:hypothetical protein